MATTYYSLQAATNGRYPAAHQTPGPIHSYAEFDIAVQGNSTAFVINDVIRMIKMPKGARVIDLHYYVPALDSSTGVVTAVGDQDGTPDDDRYVTAATVGRSGAAGMQRMAAATGVGYKFAADGYLELKVTTAASGTASTTGTIKMWATYSVDW